MTISPSNPKLFKNNFEDRMVVDTSDHDLLHLWLHDKSNQQSLVNYVLHDLPLPKPVLYTQNSIHEYHEYLKTVRFKIIQKETEAPIYGYNQYLLGIIDCVFKTEIIYQIRKLNNNNNNVTTNVKKAQQNGNLEEFSISNYILCELKPQLRSISSILGQIKVYKDKLAQRDNPSKPIYLVILTFDNDNRFDSLLASEGIKVYRIQTAGNNNGNGNAVEVPTKMLLQVLW